MQISDAEKVKPLGGGGGAGAGLPGSSEMIRVDHGRVTAHGFRALGLAGGGGASPGRPPTSKSVRCADGPCWWSPTPTGCLSVLPRLSAN